MANPNLIKASKFYFEETQNKLETIRTEHGITPIRGYQVKKLVEELQDHFHLKKVICIETGASQNYEDGCIGLFFAKLSELTGGEFHSVDNNSDIVDMSKQLYLNHNLDTNHYVQDSVTFLKETTIIPNLLHLDSWDLDLKNPFPSALHGWLEFEAIKDKMPIDSIVVIDDNYFGNMWIEWYPGGINSEMEVLDINYPIVGKGSFIYHFVESGSSNWEKISNNFVGNNNKIVYRKVKK